MCCGLVQDEDGLVCEQGAGDGEACAFSPGDLGTALPDPGVQPLGKGIEPWSEGGLPHGLVHVLVRGLGPCQAHVLEQGCGEDVRVVVDQSHAAPHLVEVELVQVDSAEADLARGRVEETQHECRQGALS